WHRRETILGIVRRPATSALVLVLCALALQLAARWAHSTLCSWASLLALLLSGIACLFGWRMAVYLLPPVLYLTWMVPMSAMLTQPVVFHAQMISTQIAYGILRLTGFEAHRYGTILQLESYTLEVAAPCSGFKTLIALSAFASCFTYLVRGSLLKKLLL